MLESSPATTRVLRAAVHIGQVQATTFFCGEILWRGARVGLDLGGPAPCTHISIKVHYIQECEQGEVHVPCLECAHGI